MHSVGFSTIWLVGIFITSGLVGIALCLRYDAALALEKKEFEEKHGISRGISVRFRVLLARFIGATALTVSIAAGIGCLLAVLK